MVYFAVYMYLLFSLLRCM